MRILISAVDSPGVAHQLIAIGLELQQLGHDVGFAGGSALDDAFARASVRKLAPPPGCEETFQIREWGGARSTVLQFAYVWSAARAFAADMIVTSPFGYGPLIAARELGLPLVMVAGISYLWTEHGGTLAIAREQIAIGRRVLGLRARTAPAHEYLGERLLLQGVPALAGPVDDAVDVRWIGDGTWDPPHEPDTELAAWCKDAVVQGRRIVYVQLGREFGARPLDDTLAALAATSELAFAVDTGRSDIPRNRTTSTIFARRFIARADILPHAALVVCSGQPTSVLGALRSGLPMVLLPHGSGTEPTAETCERAGVASVIAANAVSVVALRDAVLATAGEASMQRAAQRLGEHIAELGGARAAAGYITEIGVHGSSTRARDLRR